MNEDSSWLQTFTGKKIFPLNPRTEDICIADIAHSLSMQCRYNGHTKLFYSVAQHSAVMANNFFGIIPILPDTRFCTTRARLI